MSAARIVLKREVTRDEVGYVAYGQKWSIESVTRESVSPQRQVWTTRNGDTVITFLEDPYLELRYLVVDGEQAAEVIDILRSALPCWTLDEALGFLAESRSRDEKIHGIYLVAAAAPSGEHPQVVEHLHGLTRDPDPDVRRGLLVGMGYLAGWPVVRDIAASIKRSDPDEGIRRDAGYLLEGLNQQNAT